MSTQKPPIAPTADPASFIKDKQWYLVKYYNGADQVPPVPARNTNILLQSNNSFLGSGGCNDLRGTYLIDGDRMIVTDIRTGMMFCQNPPSLMPQESRVVELLQLITRWQVNAKQNLELYRNDQLVLEFSMTKPR